ncbi:MAG: MOSC domain-containing protein [Prolixibacteraceae bacterium]
MKIISTNIGKPATIEWRGQELQTGIYKYGVDSPLSLGFEDVAGDHVLDRRYHGGTDKACYLYSADHYSFWKRKYPDQDWQWGMFGENLTVSGLNESEIRIGDRFQVGDAIVRVTQPRQPCFKLGCRFGDQSIVDDFWNAPFPGIYLCVERVGKVKKGDEFYLLETNPESLSVSQVFSLFRVQRDNSELIKTAINDPFLAESCRKDLQKILNSI